MDNDLSKLIGTRINTLLARNDKKQKDLAQYLGVKDNTISYFISGTRMPNTEQIKKIATFFNTTADYLLGLYKEPSNDKDLTFVCEYTGLSEKSVENLNQRKNAIFFVSTVNWLIERQPLLTKIGNYLYSSVYTLFHQSEYYNKLPLKKTLRFIKVPDLAPKIYFADLIETLPLEELEVSKKIKEDPDKQEKMLFSLARQVVDIQECEWIADYSYGSDDGLSSATVFESEEPINYDEISYDALEYELEEERLRIGEEKAIEYMEQRKEIAMSFLSSISSKKDGE